jgi:hypothetical protein
MSGGNIVSDEFDVLSEEETALIVHLALAEIERRDAKIRVLEAQIEQRAGFPSDLRPAYDKLRELYRQVTEHADRLEVVLDEQRIMTKNAEILLQQIYAERDASQAAATFLQGEIDLIAEEIEADGVSGIRERLEEMRQYREATERLLSSKDHAIEQVSLSFQELRRDLEQRTTVAENTAASLKLEREGFAALLGVETPAQIHDAIRARQQRIRRLEAFLRDAIEGTLSREEWLRHVRILLEEQHA